VPGSIDQTIRRALDAIFTRPELRNREISIQAQGDLTGVFDPKKIERAFLNLILNAFQATAERDGKIDIHIVSTDERFEVRIADNGPGIPETIRDTLFDPFVSFGKSNGTGLGLAIVSKIIQDHGGTVGVEPISESGAVFLVQMPRFQEAAGDATSPVAADNGPGVISAQE
jgi:signal transduction histidine kinase